MRGIFGAPRLEMMNCWLVIVVASSGIFGRANSQWIPEPLFTRGCRSSRGQYPHESYCHQYYNCWDGRATIEECPGELLFNPVVSACDYPEAVNCGSRIRKPAPHVTGGHCLKRWGIFPDQSDCSAFYECSNGIAYRKFCPYYTAFDDKVSVCVHAYDVECGGRGGVYGTLAPPIYPLHVDGAVGSGPLSSRIGSIGGSRAGSDRRQSHQISGSSGSSASSGSGSIKGSPGGISGSSASGTGGGNRGDTGGPNRRGGTSGASRGGGSGDANRDGGSSGPNLPIIIGSSGKETGGGGNRLTGSGGSLPIIIGSSGLPGGTTGSRSVSGGSGGTAGITGIVDKDISPTGQERQYEQPISPETTFRCPHPRGLYPNALDCTRFWLCREYKPSLLKCPTGQLFDLASLSCMVPEKAQCSSISPRTT